MSQQIQETVIIRNRGQVTLPESIRRSRHWATPQSVVTISTDKPDEIVIRPHSLRQTKINWEKLWLDIERVRSYKGKGGGNLSAFIAKDRQSRR